MGFLPEGESLTIDFDCQFKVQLQDSRISTILAAFALLLLELLKEFFQKVLIGFWRITDASQEKNFVCKWD